MTRNTCIVEYCTRRVDAATSLCYCKAHRRERDLDVAAQRDRMGECIVCNQPLSAHWRTVTTTRERWIGCR